MRPGRPDPPPDGNGLPEFRRRQEGVPAPFIEPRGTDPLCLPLTEGRSKGRRRGETRGTPFAVPNPHRPVNSLSFRQFHAAIRHQVGCIARNLPAVPQVRLVLQQEKRMRGHPQLPRGLPLARYLVGFRLRNPGKPDILRLHGRRLRRRSDTEILRRQRSPSGNQPQEEQDCQ